MLTWAIAADWNYDATLNPEVEVTFIGEGNDRTRASSLRPLASQHDSRDLRRVERADEPRLLVLSSCGPYGKMSSNARFLTCT